MIKYQIDTAAMLWLSAAISLTERFKSWRPIITNTHDILWAIYFTFFSLLIEIAAHDDQYLPKVIVISVG